MSYTTHEPLHHIVTELRVKLPALQQMLGQGIAVETLHGPVEMLESFIARYDRGEIVEKEA